MRPFFPQPSHQLVDGRGLQDPAELRTKVAHQADLIDDYIVDFPFFADEMKLVGNRRRLSSAENLGFDLGEVPVHLLAAVNHLLAAIRSDLVHVRGFGELDERRDELFLSALEPAPMAPERSARHLGKVEPRQNDLLEPLLVVFKIALALKVLGHGHDALEGLLKLRLGALRHLRRDCVGGKTNQQRDQGEF